jgi:hypothetical protein
MTADVTLNCITKKINFVLIHAKANTAPTATSYARRMAAANELHDTLLTYFGNENVVVLGDFNDDLDFSITDGFVTTSYSAFTTDPVNFFSPTLALSLAGKKSTVSYNDMIDHVMLSNEMVPYYMPASASVLTDVANLVNNYGSTTTDHYPVFTRYIFVNTTAPQVQSCPVVNPFCVNISGTYTIPAFTATDDCDVVSYSYSITGATTRSGTTNNASGSFNTGTSTITWTATDDWGNTATCQTTVVVNTNPQVTIPDAFALPSGVLANTVYIGYAPASSLTLTSSVSSGTPLYSYSWSSGSTTSSATVSPVTATTYTLTVTDANGCQGTASKLVSVMDIRGGKNNDKVVICHNPAKHMNTLVISQGDVANHLAHGDMLGACSSPARNELITRNTPGETGGTPFTARAMPNPAAHDFTINLGGYKTGEEISVRVTDMSGRLIEQVVNLQASQTLKIGSDYKTGIYFAEIRQGKERIILKLVKIRD